MNNHQLKDLLGTQVEIHLDGDAIGKANIMGTITEIRDGKIIVTSNPKEIRFYLDQIPQAYN